MSYTTDVLLYVDSSSDKGIEPFMKAYGEAYERYPGSHPLKIDMDGSNGPRCFTAAVYAQGANYLPTEQLQALLDSVKWSQPHKVVLIYTTEDKPTEVLRPAHTLKYGGYFDCELLGATQQ